LVLDLGNGAVGALQRYTGLSDVDAICVSHLHSDHCMDLIGYSVYQNKHPDGPRPRIPVYGPAGAQDRLSRALGSERLGMADAFEFATLTPGTTEIGPVRVTTGHMDHSVETFGFRLEHDDRTLAYSGDTGPTGELVTIAAGADVLLCEASFVDGPDLPSGLHLTARQAAEHAAWAGVGELVLTHLVPWNDATVSFAQASEAFVGPIKLASSGLSLFG
jgi:ribonuclease BN (tRNA processing enzyme)